MRRIIIAIALLSVCFSQKTYLSEIQPILDNSCTSSCHNVSNPSGGLKLLAEYSYSELVNVASQGWPTFSRVKPNDAMNSVLYQKIVGNTSFGDRMPKGGTLPEYEAAKIKSWINNRALQDWSGYFIDVTYPVSATEWDAGNTYGITWNSNLWDLTTVVQNVSIWLNKDGKYHSFIGFDKDGSYDFTVPDTISTSDKYQVEVYFQQLEIVGRTEYFTINGGGEGGSKIYSNQFNIAGGLTYSMAVNSDRTLSGWGDYNSSADNLSNVFSIARNYFGTGILYTDGTVGYIGSGEGGPQNVPGNLNNVKMLVGGADHLLALKSDGTVVGWGKDDTGQATVPADLSGNIVGMSAGDNHSTVLFSDGTMRGWGNSYKAQNCEGITDIRPVPEAIASGRGFNIAIKNDGTVIDWGGAPAPGLPDIPVGLSDVVAVACGNYHSLALKSDGTVVAWGNNDYGQTDVPTGLNNVVAIAGGMKGYHSIALKSDGSVVAWGRDDKGQSSQVPAALNALVYESSGTGKPNTIEIVARLNQDIGVGDVHVGVWYPGSNSAPDLVDNLDNQATPSPAQGWNFQLSGSGIIPSGGPYKVEAFFDQNNNDMPDGTELVVELKDLYTDDQGYAYISIDLSGGGGIGPNLTVSLTVEGVPDGINGQAIIDLVRKSDETLIQGFQFGETTPITDMHKEFNVQGVSNGETVYLHGWYNGNNSVLLAEGQSNTFDWPPSGDIDLVLEKGTYSGPLKATVTVNGTNDSGSLSFRIFSPGTVITDELPDLINAVYGHDETVVYSSPPSNEKIEINDFLNGFAFDTYEYVVWYDVDLDEGFDPAVDPFSAGPLVLSRGQPAEINPVLNILPGPSINASNLMGLTPNEGEDLTISVDVTAHSSPLAGAVESVDLIAIVHTNGQFWWYSYGCNSSTPGTYDCNIPGNNITNVGLAIGIDAVDEYGALSGVGPYDVAVQFESINITSVPAERYIMISVPANLSNASINGVVGDELGEADPKVWRSFKWINGAYQENAGNLAIGSAVWLISKEGASINADNGYSTAFLSEKTINLSNGWNQVGNPYNFPFHLVDSQVHLSATVEQKLYQYSDGEYYESPLGRMEPGSGYWIYSSGSGTIKINPMFGMLNSSSKQLASKTTIGWKATIEVVAGSQKDGVTTFGLHPEASNDYDQQDFHEPPVIGEYITAYFNHPEAGSLSQDIRAENQDLYKWPLVIRTNQRGMAEISIPDIYEIPSYLEVKLYDPISRIVYDMRDEPSIFFTSQGTENPHYFDLLVGSANDIQDQLDEMGIIPTSFELAQNIPNPFNPVTNILVSLTEDATITLKVYNLLGEEMNAMAINRSMSKGNHRFIWAGKGDNGHQLPSGVYLYRLEVISQNGVPLFQDTKKMVLMK